MSFCGFLRCASLNQDTSTFWDGTQSFPGGEKAIIPHMKEYIQGFHMIPNTAIVVSNFIEIIASPHRKWIAPRTAVIFPFGRLAWPLPPHTRARAPLLYACNLSALLIRAIALSHPDAKEMKSRQGDSLETSRNSLTKKIIRRSFSLETKAYWKKIWNFGKTSRREKSFSSVGNLNPTSLLHCGLLLHRLPLLCWLVLSSFGTVTRLWVSLSVWPSFCRHNLQCHPLSSLACCM